MVTIKGSFEFEEGASSKRNIGQIFNDLCMLLKNDVAKITVSNDAQTLTKTNI